MSAGRISASIMSALRMSAGKLYPLTMSAVRMSAEVVSASMMSALRTSVACCRMPVVGRPLLHRLLNLLHV